jgi:hypothetical protein
MHSCARKLTAILILLLPGAGWGAAKKPLPSYDKDVQPILEKYCYDCHGDGMDKGGLALDAFKTREEMLAARDKWKMVAHNVHLGEMPPVKKPQPTLEQRDLINDWIDREVFKLDCDHPDPGRVTIRRLNRAEYNNTVRDLVGIDFHPADDFPVDDVGYGFDNIGDVLSVSPVLFEKYLAAAEKILNEAIVVGGPRLIGPVQKFEAEKMPTTGVAELYGKDFAMGLMREGEVYTNISISTPGEYLLRVRAFGQQAGKELPKLELRLNDQALATKQISALENAPETCEFKTALNAGELKLAAAYINNFRDPNNPNPDLRDRNLFIDSIELEGPLAIKPLPASHKRIFFKSPSGTNTNNVAREIIGRFAQRAFRRPIEKNELDRLFAIFDTAQKDAEPFEQSVKYALEAVLVSPHFLFRGELQPEPDNPKEIHNVDEYALATRLSYFLWSSMPDDELFALAEKKALRKNLRQQIKRMLADPRSQALVDNFASQWLQIRNLDHVTPAKETYPEWDGELRDAMKQETRLFFTAIFRENRSALEFLDADYTFVNERLAKHYGIDGVKGPEFRKVSLKGVRRGGLLTQGSILTITSNPTRTSPVKRGKWVLENILGSPTPPPPPNVPELGEVKEATGSLRQRMEEHRKNALCASCHSRMDPIGFGFENYDGVGLWRSKEGKFDIDPSGKLVSGESWKGPAELKIILLQSKKNEFINCLTEKLLTFALGRGIEYYDKCAIEKITRQMAAENYKFQSLITAIVESVPFQQRRGEEPRLAAK